MGFIVYGNTNKSGTFYSQSKLRDTANIFYPDI